MTLYEILQCRDVRSAFILGMAKNAGKTFSLNRLIEAASARGERLGLTSTGRDGEPLDLVTGKAKPRIFCPEGTIVATAEMAMSAGTAVLGGEEPTGIETVLGEVVIARVEQEGLVELAGPLFASELSVLIERMTLRGARRVLVDGSLDRKAAGKVVGEVILAVGAVVSRRMDEVVEKAVSLRQQLSISAAPGWVSDALRTVSSSGALIFDGEARALPFATMMGCGERLSEVLRTEKPWGLFVGGALGEGGFQALLGQEPLPRLVVRSPSALFVDASDWARFTRRGGLCYALQPMELLAATVNPFSPEGWEFPAEDFRGALAGALAPLPTFDLAQQAA